MTEIRTLVCDTETNGKRLLKKDGRKYNPSLSEEPYLTQLAAILYLGRREVAHLSCFATPVTNSGERVPTPKEDFFLNAGITDEVIDAVGVPNRAALGMFNNLIRVSDRVIFHNVQFDDPIVRAAYMRVAASQRQYWDTPKFCTMQSLTDVLKLPGKYGYKYPSLDEAYRALIDPMGFTGAHDAMVDVRACAEVLWVIEDKGWDLWKLKENWPEE